MTSFFIFLFLSFSAQARHTPGVEKFSIFGKAEQLPTKPGAAHLIDETELEKFEYLDVHQILRSVPGVNIQEEDGLGLRPNIGLRGAHPHRSKKVTLMEDGVLIAPAPYSAPAAYYFPSMEKIYNFEIYKGPAAVQFGPNSVGGAVNMITRRHEQGTSLDFSYGQFGFKKLQASVGFEAFGDWSVDVMGAAHQGFKVLDTDPDKNTGYEHYNYFVRWDKEFSGQQQVTVKLNWADEDSRETYLGLTNDDFNERPLHRYAASQEDKMLWNHRQLFANYTIEPNDQYSFSATTYFHQFSRNWDKFDGFRDRSILPLNVLQNPYDAENNYYYQIIEGEQDTAAGDQSDLIRLTDNGRQYLSRGVQFLHKINFDSDYFGFHDMKVGYRLHSDQVARNHVSNFFDMRSGQLLTSGLASETLAQNKHQALAHTVFVNDTVSAGNAEISLGARLENVTYATLNYLNQASGETSESALSPGVGLFYQLYSKGGILAGVNKGVTLVGPNQDASITNEEAINYELGFRHSGDIGFEAIAFYSDYKNILGTCTASSGCATSDLDRQFNGGQAEVYGVEALFSGQGYLGSVGLPLKITGTYTEARFKNSFASGLAEWGFGNVVSGDPLPYIPRFQGQVSAGVEYRKLRSFFNFNYVGRSFDQAVAQNRQIVPSYFVLNTSLQYLFNEKLKVLLRVDNILNKRYGVSYRPFGVRPGKPFTAIVGIHYDI
jgi:Fe(3+) dicitrate transport protein